MEQLVTAVPLGRPATKSDLDALPPNIKGEIINGVLYTKPRPRPRHQSVGGLITTILTAPYQLGLHGPGGWWILPEPGIELPGAAEFAPDVAGWRKERLPELPEDDAITLAPDWLCEVLSPSTRRYDRTKKRDFYAQVGVNHLWYVDPSSQELAVLRLHQGQWIEAGVYIGDDRFHAEPFEQAEINLAWFWKVKG